ncbi:HTH domain-containing protein [Brucepastera parasyntrophica]|uniref:helix-turn-helix transcriptional regulator n=1 Tax=Brucepastera parasyntrophica TaxID=2880008 RepID=UPI002108F232|nr:HTH domain-containing protein [Brucepastera parasyntrophica]ULQ58901.1 HTH domain-containing protein [Brucepastera parasyntrophica]
MIFQNYQNSNIIYTVKAERLLAIITLLLNKKKISARVLAERFSVSTRTIYRDIDALALAGIPVYALPGRDGGFELIDGFTLQRQTLETGEVQRIIEGLRSLLPAYADSEIEDIIEKFTLLLNESKKRGISCSENHVFIEHTPSPQEKETLDTIEKSIKEKMYCQ